ncbi:MAG: Unknown protein [uncultured Sulfurovum sp.]|uniref:Uncharacterized protein n=1 Tax=uncultured Sulfurovum sp. TaxID=269237 RepID=A0A6S6S5Q9_9BACT|nr:MAG: Unknown protein [uncultured Sulfurovum sp.]
MQIVKTLSLVSLILSLNYADTSIKPSKIHYLDTLHADISEKVLDWSSHADLIVSGWLGYDNNQCDITPPQDHIASKKVDSFFQNNKYIEETDDVFIRVRTDTTLQTKEDNEFRLKFRAQLPFSRCREQLKIFVEDVALDKDKTKNQINENTSTDVGFRYVAKKRHGIKSRYSLGLSGISPFLSARYTKSYQIDDWEVDPVQTFKYSLDDYFKEDTNIYFDKSFQNDALFRLTLERGTESKKLGMDYGLKLEYYTNANANSGLHFAQGFYGNTRYRHRDKAYRIDHPKNEYSGVHNYVTTISYRANIWRKWFYYEIKPSVNFHKDFDYEPNYALRFFFDFYFGEYK